MFKRHDCPHIMNGANVWCKLKANQIINNPKLTQKTKYALFHKMTCSGCDIYKQIKKNKPKGNKEIIL